MAITEDLNNHQETDNKPTRGTIGELKWYEDDDGFVWLEGINEPKKITEDTKCTEHTEEFDWESDRLYDEEMQDRELEAQEEEKEAERDFRRTWLYDDNDFSNTESEYEKPFAPLDVPDDLDWDRS